MKRRVPFYDYYINTGSTNGKLKIVSCFLCQSQRLRMDGSPETMYQITNWPTLHAHRACIEESLAELAQLAPCNRLEGLIR
jgi:hypothetical protein